MTDLKKLFPDDSEVPRDDVIFPDIHGIPDIDNPAPGIEQALVDIMKNGLEVSLEDEIIKNIVNSIELRVLEEEFNKTGITDIDFSKISHDMFRRGCEMDKQYTKFTRGIKETLGISVTEGQKEFYKARVLEYLNKQGFEDCIRTLAQKYMDQLVGFARGEIKLGKK